MAKMLLRNRGKEISSREEETMINKIGTTRDSNRAMVAMGIEEPVKRKRTSQRERLIQGGWSMLGQGETQVVLCGGTHSSKEQETDPKEGQDPSNTRRSTVCWCGDSHLAPSPAPHSRATVTASSQQTSAAAIVTSSTLLMTCARGRPASQGEVWCRIAPSNRAHQPPLDSATGLPSLDLGGQ